MALPITFPSQDFFTTDNSLSLCNFQKVDQIHEKVEKLCQQQFLVPNFIQFLAIENQDQIFLKCTKLVCVAFLLYEKKTIDNCAKYVIKQHSNMHTHLILQFRAISPEVLRPHLKAPKIINFPCSNEQAQSNKHIFPQGYIMHRKNKSSRNQILNYLHEKWAQLHGKQNLLFIYVKRDNSANIYCRQSAKTNKIIKCKWKMVYKKVFVDKQQYYELQVSQSNFQHTHYALLQHERNEFYKEKQREFPQKFKKNKGILLRQSKLQKKDEDKINEQEQENIEKPVFRLQSIFQAPDIDLDQNPPLYYVLTPLLQSLKQNGFCHKFFNNQKAEERKYSLKNSSKQGNQIDQILHLVDFQDIVVISSKPMRYFCRSYGEVVYMTQTCSGQFTKDESKSDTLPDTFTTIVFTGLNFYEKLVFLGASFCRNATLQKLSKILLIFVRHHLKSLKTLVIEQTEQSLLFIARHLKKQKKCKFNIITIPKKAFKKTNNKFMISDQCSKYADINCGAMSTLKRQKIYDDQLYVSKVKTGNSINAHQQQQQQKQRKASIMEDNNRNWHPYLIGCFIGYTMPCEYATNILNRCVNSAKRKFQKMIFPSSQIHNLAFFHEQNLALFAEIAKLNNQWCLREHQQRKVEKYYPFRELISCRFFLSKFIFDKLMNQIILIQKCSAIVSQKNFCLIDDGLSSYVVQMIDNDNSLKTVGRLKLRTLLNRFDYAEGQKQTYSCECGLKQITGIPCCHILKVANRKIGLLESIKLEKVLNRGIIKPRKKKYFEYLKRSKKLKSHDAWKNDFLQT